MAQFSPISVRMLVLVISGSSLIMGGAGIKSRTPGQILEKSYTL